jgi:hypothetical protein
MITNIYPTKSQSSHVRIGQRHHMGGEQDRREMRAALHDLQQRLGQSHNGPSGAQVIVTAGPAPSTKCRMRGRLFLRLRGIYTLFTSCGLS